MCPHCCEGNSMNSNVYPSGCSLPSEAEIIESGSIMVSIEDKPATATFYKSAPTIKPTGGAGTKHPTGGYSRFGASDFDEDEWYYGRKFHAGGRSKSRRKSGKPKSTRGRNYNLPATKTSSLNWIRRDDIDWDVLEFEYYSLVNSAKSKGGNKQQKEERVKHATTAFRAFVMVSTLLIDNDRPSKESNGGEIPSYNQVWQHIEISLGARLMLASLVSSVAKYGGKKIAGHMINAIFRQSWKLQDDSFMMTCDPVARQVVGKSLNGIYSGRVSQDVVDWVADGDTESFAKAVITGRHNHSECVFKARINNTLDGDDATKQLLWTAYTTPNVLTALVSQVYLMVNVGDRITIGEIVDIMDMTFVHSIPGCDIEDHEWIDVYQAALDGAGLTDVLAKIIAFVIDISANDVDLTKGAGDDKIIVQKTGPESGL